MAENERHGAGKQKLGEVNNVSQNYTLEKPKTAINAKLKPQQIELPFGKKKTDSVSKAVPAARREVRMRRRWEIGSFSTILHNAGK